MPRDSMRTINEIIIHCSATKDSGTVSWGAIRRYHTNEKGWSGIGYHVGIELVGNEYEALYGRPVVLPGAHTVGHNAHSIGICFVGDYDTVPPPESMLVLGGQVIADLLIRFGLTTDAIHGHREFANKTCPGTMFDLDKLKLAARQHLIRWDKNTA